LGEIQLHAGLIVIVPCITPTFQRRLVSAAPIEASKLPDMINKVIEIDSDVRVYELPKLE
jgi:hypothetical protein